MSSEVSRRATALLLLLIFIVGSFVVLGWIFKAALFALGLFVKLAVGGLGLLILVFLVYLLVKAVSRKE